MIQIFKNHLFTVIITVFFVHFSTTGRTQTVSVPAGSFLVKTGSTIGSGLKPYGLVYLLVTAYDVPVYWCINPGKVKGAPDFSHNGINYTDGTFVISSNYITPVVDSVITSWRSSSIGVVGHYAVSAFSAPIFDTITSFPIVLVDNSTGGDPAVLVNYLNNAGVPSSAYTQGSPSGLNGCHDMFASPHSEPTWGTHNFLRNFTTISKGNIWVQCHGVSVLEGQCDPGNSSIRLNFLTTNGLQCYKKNACGCTSGNGHTSNRTNPTSYFFPSHPIMQFPGLLDDASNDGNEKWFIPNTTTNATTNSVWNSSASRGVRTSDGTIPAEGTLLVFGPAYNNAANGMVMYQAAHDLNNGTEASKVAAQRPFLNYLLLTGLMRGLTATTNIPSSVVSSSTTSFTAQVTNGLPPYTFQWTASEGTLSSPNSPTTNYTAPQVTGSVSTPIEVRLKVTDGCGRVNIILYNLTGLPNVLPVDLLTFEARVTENEVKAEWVTVSEKNNDFFTLERSPDATAFEVVGRVNGAGNSTSMRYYSLDDRKPLSGTSYYRLKQTDFDGSVSYSRIVPVKISLRDIAVYPNPATEVFYIDLSFQTENAPIEVKLIDVRGRLVYSNRLLQSQSNGAILELRTNELAKGPYTLVCSSDEHLWRKQIVLQ